MRPLFILAALLISPVAIRADGVEFLRVWPAWRGVESFDRIREYFGGSESTERRVMLRTQGDVRDGYYFLVRVKNTTPAEAFTFELNVIRPDSPEPVTFRFAATVPPGESVFQLGLTGRDWPGGEKTNPVAWRLALLGSDGHAVAERKSFLWEKPSK